MASPPPVPSKDATPQTAFSSPGQAQGYPDPATIESGLEVAHNNDEREMKEAYNVNPSPYYQSSSYYSTPGYPAGHGTPQAMAAEPTAPVASAPEPKKICGLKRGTFFIVACVTAVLLVGAIVGGVVGGLKARNSSDDSSGSAEGSNSGSGSSSGDDDSGSGSGSGSSSGNSTDSIFPEGWETNVLPASRLAATNWTDTGGTWHAVFFQDADEGHIFSSIYSAQNSSWTMNDVTAALADDASIPAPKSGTAMAAIAKRASFDMRLYFASEDDNLIEVVSTDGVTWSKGDIGRTTIKELHEDSDIGAVWQECGEDSCHSEYPVVVFQNKDNNLEAANGTLKNIIEEDITAGSGLGLTQQGSAYQELRLHYHKDGVLTEVAWANAWSSTRRSLVDIEFLPQIDTQGFGEHNWLFLIIASLTDDGTVSMDWWNEDDWNTDNVPSMVMADSVTQASPISIATNLDMQFFGLQDGRIYQWSMSYDNPFALTYVGEVNTPDKSS